MPTTTSLQTIYTESLFVVETVSDFTMPSAINTPVTVSVTMTAMFQVGSYAYVRNELGTKYGTFKVTATTLDTLSLSLDSLSHKSGTGTVAAGSKITPSAKPSTGGGGTGTGLTTVYTTDLTVTTEADFEYLLDGTTTVNFHSGTDGDRVALKDFSRNASAVNITLNPDGTDTLEKQAVLTLSNDGIAVEFVFYNGDWSMVNVAPFADYLYNDGSSLTAQQIAAIGYTGVYQ